MTRQESDGTTPLSPMERDLGPQHVRGFRLEVLGESRAQDFDSGRCQIGTSRSCDLILDDDSVSKIHCEVLITPEGARIRDLGSRNGTVVDGTRVVEGFLKGRSLIRIGRTTLRFQYIHKSARIPLSKRTDLGLLVGQSMSMRALFAILEKAAATDKKILLEGETGTGKSLTAESVHLESRRKDKPFIVVDCGALPRDLIESELFGHKRGAFTGAISDRVGSFEAANGGTIFLDEIGELPMDLQPKLLRVLERGELQRVGDDSSKTRKVDVRVICATNRDLRAQVNADKFREDLYYRIAVLRIRVPPLRERLDDLPTLARTILLRQGESEEQIARLLTPKRLSALRGIAWPGNIRELTNYLELCTIYDSPPLPDELALDNPAGPSGPIDVDLSLPFSEAKQRVKAQFERYYIAEYLRQHNGNVSEVAKAAGINRTYVYRMMRDYKIPAPS